MLTRGYVAKTINHMFFYLLYCDKNGFLTNQSVCRVLSILQYPIYMQSDCYHPGLLCSFGHHRLVGKLI